MSSSEGEHDVEDGDEYEVADHNAARRAYTQAQPGRKKDGRKKKSKNVGGGFESMGLSFPGEQSPRAPRPTPHSHSHSHSHIHK
jgi:hypothetical protein